MTETTNKQTRTLKTKTKPETFKTRQNKTNLTSLGALTLLIPDSLSTEGSNFQFALQEGINNHTPVSFLVWSFRVILYPAAQLSTEA